MAVSPKQTNTGLITLNDDDDDLGEFNFFHNWAAHLGKKEAVRVVRDSINFDQDEEEKEDSNMEWDQHVYNSLFYR